jgi:hypothetical protein
MIQWWYDEICITLVNENIMEENDYNTNQNSIWWFPIPSTINYWGGKIIS